MRVLMPQRFDVLSRSMDANIVSQWLALEAACDLVLWGPGLEGFVPGMPLDEVAEHLDADVVLLPDLHHAIPGLWSELWKGSERCRRPVVWHLVDQGTDVPARRAVWEQVRPAAILICYAERRLQDYEDLRARFGTEVLTVPWGFDACQFHPPDAAAERDVDVLIAGAEVPDEVYRMRNRIKRAARSLASELRVLDISHPGYWESTGVVLGRGQAAYADLLRRSRLATTGTAFGALTRKYWEAAGCGAIGVGDLPLDEPDASRFEGVTLAVESSWDEQRIAAEIRRLLADEHALGEMSAAASSAMRGCDHHERARDYVAALGRVAIAGRPARRPRPFPARGSFRSVCVAGEPDRVPTLRRNWIDAWDCGREGQSRTRRLERALEGPEEVAVVAFDPDAALDVDALVLATACEATGRIVLRPGTEPHFGDVLAATWSVIAAPRAALAEAVSSCGGRAGVEQALLVLGRRLGWQILPGGSYVDPATDLLRLVHAPSAAGIERAISEAAEQRRHILVGELEGLRATRGGGEPPPLEPPPLEPPPDDPLVAQDPECPLLDGAVFAPLHPRHAPQVEAVVDYARLGARVPPLHIGIPLSAGVSVEHGLALLAQALTTAGVDLDGCAELVLLERPLFAAEMLWLSSNLPAGSACHTVA